MANFSDGQVCDLRDPSPMPDETAEAMAYVLFQQYGAVYQPEMGFEAGTIFPELNKPFLGRRGDAR